jgi:hypothetical protein
MARKPTVASGYSPATVQLVNAACLYIATKLGDLRDDIVIVGGLVPSLIVPESTLPAGRPLHVGTLDVDLGIEDLFSRLQPLLAARSTLQALTILERDFTEVDSVGVLRFAAFLGDPNDEAVRADAAGAVRSLLGLCRKGS